MRKLMMAAIAIMIAMSVQAQKIEVIDNDGNPVPLVNVLNEKGILIGITDLNGVLADVRGAQKIALTHVAYKPQLVTVEELENGKVLMEDFDYNLADIVVKPKPYLYMEYYFRAFSYIDDSLRVYTAGILPMAYEIQNHYKVKTHSAWAFGGAANKALTWNTQDLQLRAEQLAKDGVISIEKSVLKNEKFKERYHTTVEKEENNRWLIKNPEGVVGHYYYDDKVYRATVDAGKMQIYANKANGEKKLEKAREERNYDYQYSEVYDLDDENNVLPEGKIMEMSRWEYDNKKGRKITIVYLYTTDHSYMDEAEFKARCKEFNKGRTGDMSLEELKEYERAHKLPSLTDIQTTAICQLTKQTGKKK